MQGTWANNLPLAGVISPVRDVLIATTTANSAVTNIYDKPDYLSETTLRAAAPTTKCFFSRMDGAGHLLEFATGEAANEVATFRIWEWNRIIKPGGDALVSGVKENFIEQWHAFPVGLLTVTAGTKVGIAGGLVTNSQQYCDTIALTTDRGYTGQVVLMQGSADNAPAKAKVDHPNCPLIEIERMSGTGTWLVLSQAFTGQ